MNEEPQPDSSFERDEEARRQRDAVAKMRESVGIQDEDGNQLHGHARTERARDLREQMKTAVQTQEVAEKEKPKPPEPAALRASINAPHKVTVRGLDMAFTIAPIDPKIAGQDDSAGSSSETETRSLALTNTENDDGDLLVIWGSSNGLPIDGMNVGGVPGFYVTPEAGYFYVKGTFNRTLMEWTLMEFVFDSDGTLEATGSTSTEAYKLLGTITGSAGSWTIAQETYGPTEVDRCKLINP